MWLQNKYSLLTTYNIGEMKRENKTSEKMHYIDRVSKGLRNLTENRFIKQETLWELQPQNKEAQGQLCGSDVAQVAGNEDMWADAVRN